MLASSFLLASTRGRTTLVAAECTCRSRSGARDARADPLGDLVDRGVHAAPEALPLALELVERLPRAVALGGDRLAALGDVGRDVEQDAPRALLEGAGGAKEPKADRHHRP